MAPPKLVSIPLLWAPWKRGPARRTERDVVVSLTEFRVHRFRDLAGVARNGLRFRRGWRRIEGSIALALWVKPLTRTVGSLSIWQSEADLRRFLRSPDHVDVVRQFRPRMTGDTAIWRTDRIVLSNAWDEAQRRLADKRSG